MESAHCADQGLESMRVLVGGTHENREGWDRDLRLDGDAPHLSTPLRNDRRGERCERHADACRDKLEVGRELSRFKLPRSDY
jgi:hypothetical protein